MSRTLNLCFSFPEPPKASTRLIPFFLPFVGCPGHCLYCNQYLQTGVAAEGLEQSLAKLRIMLAKIQGKFSLGFFGGTFTGLTWTWQQRFLDLVAPYKEQGQLTHIRISTRPDCLDQTLISDLQTKGVDMIELGIQSFDPQVLAQSGRGYNGEQASSACRLVQGSGLALVIQLLPGLPGHEVQHWAQDVAWTIDLNPEAVRIYPCLVMADTGLAKMYVQGQYQPWSMDKTKTELSWAVLKFWENKIGVLRLGLAPEGNFADKILAGPWHPALGNMVRSQILKVFLEKKIQALGPGYQVRKVWMPQRLSGDLWGHGRANVRDLRSLGITSENVQFCSKTEIVMELEA